ncbi:MAG: penicillin-binding protein 2, partial [Novosphingobium sp.]|nr:penicillin-binding protein 2 [Novosphingobium sp.]
MTALVISTRVSRGGNAIATLRQHLLLVAKWRAMWLLALFAVIAACAILRLILFGMFESAQRGMSLAEALLPDRGAIVDRNGVLLAGDIDAYALWFNPKALDDGPPLVKTPLEVARALNRIFPDMDVEETAARLASGKPGYLRRRILPEEANRVHALGEPALEFPREAERYYPQGSMAAHVLGFVSADGIGRVGMEEVFNEQLTDPVGRGTPAVLSIDARVQGALEDELGRGMLESEARGAAGIILDVDTGEVLALASLPAFDPNRIVADSTPNIFNRVTNQVYELGSTFKPITIAAAIDAGTITDLARRFPADKPLAVGRFRISDSHRIGASVNVPEALIHSSNIVTAQIADELGGDRLMACMRALGMHERPYIELPARGYPLWPGSKWSRITTMTVSFGHGIAVTPLHLASAYAALVNGGIWRPATLRKLKPGQVPEGRRVFKAATSA